MLTIKDNMNHFSALRSENDILKGINEYFNTYHYCVQCKKYKLLKKIFQIKKWLSEQSKYTNNLKYHSYPFPFLVGISKTTLDKSLGLTQYQWDFRYEVHTKRSYMHKLIIPEQIVENPNFKQILVVKERPPFLCFMSRTKYIVYCM